MTIEKLSKNFLKEVETIFKESGFGSISYEKLGYLFSDYFMGRLAEAYQNDPDGFMSLVSVCGAEPPIY